MSRGRSLREGFFACSGRRLGSGSLLCLGLLAVIPVNVSGVSGPGWEIDEVAIVTRTVDGDTFDTSSLGRIRLADLNTAEVGRVGAREATDYLSSFIRNRLVYLDMDDLYGSDVYGRVVAVVHVRHNATHLLNMNEALLEAGHAIAVDFPNEFDPMIWTLYVRYPAFMDSKPESTPTSIVAVAAMAVAIVIASLIVLLRRRRGRLQ